MARDAIPRCKRCGKPIAWVKSINPRTHREKWLPIDRRSWDGQSVFDKRVHVSHFKTCEKLQARPTRPRTPQSSRDEALNQDFQQQMDLSDLDEYNNMKGE